MPNTDVQEVKSIEFSPICNGNEITGNTPESIKDGSQSKRTSFTKRFAAMGGMRPKKKEKMITGAGESKTFRTIFAIIMEAGNEENKAPDQPGEQKVMQWDLQQNRRYRW